MADKLEVIMKRLVMDTCEPYGTLEFDVPQAKQAILSHFEQQDNEDIIYLKDAFYAQAKDYDRAIAISNELLKQCQERCVRYSKQLAHFQSLQLTAKQIEIIIAKYRESFKNTKLHCYEKVASAIISAQKAKLEEE